MDRVLAWLLRLYPRQMRRRYGHEIATLTLDLIRLEGRSPVRLSVSLALDGLGCRIAWLARTRVATATAVTTTVACVALVNMGGASAKQAGPGHRPATAHVRSVRHAPAAGRAAHSRNRKTLRLEGFRESG
ncbi:MAG TPA: hypothetical protein VKT31_01475 [Solirubrobacteraceae bacterium]|nr:hypothetical protein [Solirubrobacteraceae bacterium]